MFIYHKIQWDIKTIDISFKKNLEHGGFYIPFFPFKKP